MTIVRLLASDNGTHGPAELAQWTVMHAMDVIGNAPGVLYSEARGLHEKLWPLLVDLHELVQSDERARLRDQGPERLLSPIDVNAETAEAVRRIKNAAPSLEIDLDQLKACIRSNLHHTAWIERSWYADACMGEPAAAAFFVQVGGGPAAEHVNHMAAQAFRAHAAEGVGLLSRSDAELDALGGRVAVSNLTAAANPHIAEV